jgi:hypothetical protein
MSGGAGLKLSPRYESELAYIHYLTDEYRQVVPVGPATIYLSVRPHHRRMYIDYIHW